MRPETRDIRHETGDVIQETGDRIQKAGDRRHDMGDRSRVAAKMLVFVFFSRNFRVSRNFP